MKLEGTQASAWRAHDHHVLVLVRAIAIVGAFGGNDSIHLNGGK